MRRIFLVVLIYTLGYTLAVGDQVVGNSGVVQQVVGDLAYVVGLNSLASLGSQLRVDSRLSEDGIALEVMKLIKKSLLIAVKNGKDLKARGDLLAAASMGSTSFQKGLGAIHSLSHPVNSQFNVHHGL